jgi:hypothetical protein
MNCPSHSSTAAGSRIAGPALASHARRLFAAAAGEDVQRILLNDVPRISFDGTTAGAASYEGDALVIPVYQVEESMLYVVTH